MHRFTVSVDIDATAARVWRALCDPAAVVQWDTGVAAALDAPDDYPRPGQHVRWRYSGGPFRILHDRPREVVPERVLRSLIALGPFRFDETYVLEHADGACRLSATMLCRAVLPVVGGLVERVYLRRATKRTVASSLRAIKRHCERMES